MADKIRTLRVVENGDSLALVIRERQGTQAPKVDAYFLTPTAGVVEFSKHDGTKHQVTESTCDCRDQKYRGRLRPCKHIGAVRKLQSLGKLPLTLTEVKHAG